MIKREHYISKIRGFYDSDLIKIIEGICCVLDLWVQLYKICDITSMLDVNLIGSKVQYQK